MSATSTTIGQARGTFIATLHSPQAPRRTRKTDVALRTCRLAVNGAFGLRYGHRSGQDACEPSRQTPDRSRRQVARQPRAASEVFRSRRRQLLAGAAVGETRSTLALDHRAGAPEGAATQGAA